MARRISRTLGIAASAAALALSLSAGAAFAGDITGQGKYIAGSDDAALNGKSICAYSGLNDEYYILGDTSATRTQSWGRIPKDFRAFLTSIGHNPGIACNPSKH